MKIVNYDILNKFAIDGEIAKQTYLARSEINKKLNQSKILGFEFFLENLNLSKNIDKIHVVCLVINNDKKCFLFIDESGKILGFLYPNTLNVSPVF